MEPTLFGIGKAQWELINSFSNWLSAIGTVAAVIVSLYLSSRASKPRIEVTVGIRQIIQRGQEAPFPEVIIFRVVNSGDRTVRVTQLSWRIGLWKKRFAVQLHDIKQSSPLPIELAHAQEASWLVPLDARPEGWLVSFSSKMLFVRPWLSCKTLRAQVSTSTGHVFTVRPETGLVTELKKTCNALRSVA